MGAVYGSVSGVAQQLRAFERVRNDKLGEKLRVLTKN